MCLPSHILRVIENQDSCRELDDRFSCCIKSLKKHKWEYLWLLWIKERSSLWTRSCHIVVVVSFLLKVGLSTGRVCAQPGLDPNASGGGKV